MTTPTQGVRFGLVGTGYWALETHGRALADSPRSDFVSIWGRDQNKATAAAERFGVRNYADFDEFLDSVDAVSFAVPPFVQSELGLRAIEAGKHVLFEKPLALSLAEAEKLAEAAARTGVAGLVYFTILFDARVRALLADSPGWAGGSGLWLGSALSDENPFNTPWRREYGALWDLAPHALSVFWAGLGPITSVTADAGNSGMTHLVLHHPKGVTSAASVTLIASDAADGFQTVLWGEQGRTEFPVDDVDERLVLATALDELVDQIQTGRRDHPCSIQFGRDIVRVMDMAQRQLDSRKG